MPHPILPHPIHILETLKLFHYHYLSKSMETPEVPPYPLFLFLSPSFPLYIRKDLGKGVYRNMPYYLSSFPHQNFTSSLWQRQHQMRSLAGLSNDLASPFSPWLENNMFPIWTASILEQAGRFFVFVFSCVPSQLRLYPG